MAPIDVYPYTKIIFNLSWVIKVSRIVKSVELRQKLGMYRHVWPEKKAKGLNQIVNTEIVCWHAKNPQL